MSADVIPPGGEGEIKVTLTPKGNQPEISKKVVVETNDPEQPKFTLTMQGTLVYDASVRPTVVSIRDLPLNTSGTGTFALHMAEGTTAKVVSVEVAHPDVFSIRRTEGNAEGTATYEVRYKGRATVGTDNSQVIIKTDGENTPELTIPIQASASLNLRYADKMRFTYRQGVLQERVFRLSSRNGDAPKIEKIEDPDGLLDTEILDPQGPMASVRCTIKQDKLDALAPEPRAGWHTLIVHTNDKQEPKVEVQYSVAPVPKTPTPATVAPRAPAGN